MEDRGLQKNVESQRKDIFESYQKVNKILQIQGISADDLKELSFWLSKAEEVSGILFRVSDVDKVQHLELLLDEAHNNIIRIGDKVLNEFDHSRDEIKRLLCKEREAKTINRILIKKTKRKVADLTLKKDGGVVRNLRI